MNIKKEKLSLPVSSVLSYHYIPNYESYYDFAYCGIM